MPALRPTRRLGRLLAVWLLLWFLTMAVTRVPAPAGVDGPRAATAVATAQADPQSHHHHGADEPEPAEPELAVTLHAGHASGSLSHCPLCTHGAAPPPRQFAPAPAGEAPTARPGAQGPAALRVRTDAPPPARGPPLLA